jgi:hypothetical protein
MPMIWAMELLTLKELGKYLKSKRKVRRKTK